MDYLPEIKMNQNCLVIDRKSQSVLKIEKNKDQKTIDLVPTFLRSSDEFDPISIRFTGSYWEQVNTNAPTTNDMIYGMEKRSLISRLLQEPKNYKDLVNDLSEFIGKGQSTAKKIIKEWIVRGDILKVGELYKQK